MMDKHPLYFTIHGHFISLRENPWTWESSKNQRSASPYHDWNDRIAQRVLLQSERGKAACSIPRGTSGHRQ